MPKVNFLKDTLQVPDAHPTRLALISMQKKRKVTKKKKYETVKRAFQQNAGSYTIGTNVILAYDKAEKIGVELDDVKLFVTAMTALCF